MRDPVGSHFTDHAMMPGAHYFPGCRHLRMSSAFAKLQEQLIKHRTLSFVPLVLVVALSCWAARSTAIHISKQTDVQLKKPSETYEDFSFCAFVAVLLAVARPALKTWPALVTMPVAAALFAYISNLKSLQASLNAPTPGLLVTLGVVAVSLIALVSHLCIQQPAGVVPAVVTLILIALYISSVYAAAKADAREGYETVAHIHHFMIGIMLVLLLTNFDSIIATGVAAIGLAVTCHGFSVYRPTSPFCGWRVPCDKTRYGDVPSVKVA